MKRVFIPTRKIFNLKKIDFSSLKKIKENKIALCYSIQFEELAKNIEKQFDKKIAQRVQVLGCSSPKFNKEIEAILIIGEGKFHPVSLSYTTGKKVYVFNEFGLKEINQLEISNLEKREKGAYLKYLNSKKVGIIISTKPGQQKMQRAIDFKKENKDKKNYLFITNEINVNEFENFKLNSWINSACPRIDLDNTSIINMSKIEKLNSRH
jgi:2-(3-amino-3-carboxypropyl)histidine synthase